MDFTADGAPRDVPDAMRIALNAAVFVLLWCHLWFQNLADRSTLGASEDGSRATQALFVVAALAMAAAIRRIGARALRPLATPLLVLCAVWLGLTALVSVEPSLSLRRLALLAISAMLAAGVLIVARSPRQFALSLAVAALVILASSYLAVALVPDLATHSAFDTNADPSHAGLWRGVFPHKNETGAAMVILVMVGLYVASAWSRAAGWGIVALALGLLVGSGSKTAIALLPVILGVSWLFGALRAKATRSILLVAPVLGLLLVSVGSILVPAVKEAVGGVVPDASFTGRDEIWQFSIDNILTRPWQGWGIGAFWMTERTMYGGAEDLTWVTTANHAHNAFLETLLIGGVPFLVLTVLAFLLAPIRDLVRLADGRRLDAETLLFLRLWFYGLVSASFESVLYNGNNSACCMFMMAVFGLRLRTRYAIAGGRRPRVAGASLVTGPWPRRLRSTLDGGGGAL